MVERQARAPDRGTVNRKQHSRYLTARQTDIIARIANGQDDPTMARELGLSNETIRTHVRAIRDKLGARTRAQAVALAHSQGHIKGKQ